MKLGLFSMPLHPPSRPYWDILNENRELCLFADRLGFEEAFFGEHVTDAKERITSSLLFIAWLLGETKSINLGTGTVNVAHHHPAQLAAEVAMIDHMAEGRFIMGISPGNLMSDAEILGTYGSDRNEMLVEAMDHVLALWKCDGPYHRTGKYWTISTRLTAAPELGLGSIPKPFQKPHPPIVVTALSPWSKGVTQAAMRGWHPISANFMLPKWVKTHWTQYVKGCCSSGRNADSANWRVAKSIFVADDLKVAEAYVNASNGPYYYYYDNILSKLIKHGREGVFKENELVTSVNTEQVVDNVVIWGTPDKVVDDLLHFQEQIGEFGTLLYVSHDCVDKRLALRSMELMVDKVMPAVTAAGGASDNIERG